MKDSFNIANTYQPMHTLMVFYVISAAWGHALIHIKARVFVKMGL